MISRTLFPTGFGRDASPFEAGSVRYVIEFVLDDEERRAGKHTEKKSIGFGILRSEWVDDDELVERKERIGARVKDRAIAWLERLN